MVHSGCFTGFRRSGVFLMSENGSRWIRWVAQQLPRTPDQLMAWNEAAQRELDRIQAALNRVADSLETAQ